ncbi:MAG: methyltransferase domain-containing protein [Candidatus Taylorbacteria bacterium]|nr:methyltransferase domain-containing protein [Candidatus Taylorbacteria bacterium]
MARRVQLAREVAKVKMVAKLPLYRGDKEKERLEEVGKWADTEGIDPLFARSLLYSVIGESCKQQMILKDSCNGEVTVHVDKESWHKRLRANLIELTKMWAPTYDKEYGKEFVSTRLHQAYEEEILGQMVESLPHHEAIVDLGCATGRVALQFGPRFRQRFGYDVSPDMIEVALRHAAERHNRNVYFEVHDIEMGIPLANDSVSLVVMNQGTGSDIQNISGLLAEIERVLKPEGQFFVSFYNAQALAYRTFLPWPLTLAAEINVNENYLEVHCKGKIIPVYAEAYSVDKVENLFTGRLLSVTQVSTHPTVGAILPNDVYTEQAVASFVERLDRSLALGDAYFGAYIVVCGVKNRSV